MNFTDLAQANADHFNEHPVVHTAIAVVGLVVALRLTNAIAYRIAGSPKD